ncbi:hypothetical protein E1176_01105, partial [Fulvivirga sp. RKSG066]|uniref:sugar transferase n=1 Tax=Fulvivirga aurantia TaxID=2529383 RepID=UPI0012BD566D
MNEQITVDGIQKDNAGENKQLIDKKLLCISASGSIRGLEKSFIEPEVIDSVYSLRELLQSKPDFEPNAVLFFPEKINNETLSQTGYAQEVMKSFNVPLIVISNDTDENHKKAVLKNGADDYISGEINPESLSYWINFLKVLKKLSQEKTKLQIEPFNYKISTAKRIFDIVVSASVLIMLSPLLLIIAAIIKLESKGPVFYISQRAGSGYKIFNFYKFRSMDQGAEKDLDKVMHLNQYGGDVEVKDKSGNPVFYKIKDDPRVTRFGNFLRNTSLDEIPQLINVLKGDMSIVGNRPLPLYEAQQLTKDQCAMRFMAAAGITGLWQVTKRGRAEMSVDERIDLDISYANSA